MGTEKKKRELRADELTDICQVLKINPMDYADGKEGEGNGKDGNTSRTE